MAILEKFTMKQLTGLLRENLRESKKYKNNVDRDKSHLNYDLTPKMNSKQKVKKFKDRINEVMQGRELQKNAVPVFQWVISLPKPLLGTDKEEDFFDTCYKFCCDRYGKDNIMSAIVHMDEGNPHIHITGIGVGVSRKSKTGAITVNTSSVFTKKELMTFHPDLDKVCEKKFGIAGLVKNDKTLGGVTMEQLKEDTEFRKFLDSKKTKSGKTLLQVFDDCVLEYKSKKTDASRSLQISEEKQVEATPSVEPAPKKQQPRQEQQKPQEQPRPQPTYKKPVDPMEEQMKRLIAEGLEDLENELDHGEDQPNLIAHI